ncbi:MAG: CoA-binding protein [Myxococcaceae bacterium]
MDIANLERAREFLGAKSIAVVGVSRNPKHFTRYVFGELAKRGYDVVPVNAEAGEIDGRPAFKRVQDVSPAAEAALLYTRPERTEAAVRDCLEAKVRRIWMPKGAGPGSASEAAVALCEANGIAPVQNLCPFMALPRAGWFHRVHGFFRRGMPERRRLPATT